MSIDRANGLAGQLYERAFRVAVTSPCTIRIDLDDSALVNDLLKHQAIRATSRSDGMSCRTGREHTAEEIPRTTIRNRSEEDGTVRD